MRSRIASDVASSSGGRNSCSGGSSSRIVTGKPAIASKIPLEVALLQREQPVERAAALVLVAREDHLAHDREPVVGHEHVLGAAEPDPLGAELTRLCRVFGRVGVCPHAEPTKLVRPAQDRPEVLVDRGRNERDGSR